MIDIHSHIIFGVDDGAESMEESVRMLQAAYEAGVTVIIATPHLKNDLKESPDLVENYRAVADAARVHNITVCLGNEVRINPFLPDIIKKNAHVTLDKSRYLLLEFPFDSIPIYADEIIYKLNLMDITTVIAHPERNLCFAKDIKLLTKYIEMGCLIQINAGSLLGVYGFRAKRLVKKLIHLGNVHFIASDAHSPEAYSKWYADAYKKAKKWAGEEYTNLLFKGNGQEILKEITRRNDI